MKWVNRNMLLRTPHTHVRNVSCASSESAGPREPVDEFDSWLSSLDVLSLPANPGRVVVVAPHPDDETLGAGSLMHDLSHSGWDVQVVVVSDGAASHSGVNELAAVRSGEVRRACEALGLKQPPILLNYPDGKLHLHSDAVAKDLRAEIQGCDVVVAPRFGDGHSDHEATALAVDVACSQRAPRRPAVWGYAIWTWDRFGPTNVGEGAVVYRASADAAVAKTRAIDAYPSQTTDLYGSVIVSEEMLERFTGGWEVFWC